CIKTLEFPWTF
nr:immunoglobulin light chain junction region [Macaca mulatta]